MSVKIRNAAPKDAAAIHAMIRELAAFEKLSRQVKAGSRDLARVLGGPRPLVRALIALKGREPVAYALYFFSYSTFVGRPGLYLEDLYVKPPFRGLGIGKQLLSRLARIAKSKSCGRMEWSVINWNRRAIRFYKSLGARPLNDWTTYRLEAKGLGALASAQ
jgi:GNAT superfamily N-acetyltransferase